MSEPSSAKSFLRLLEMSGIVDKEDLKPAIQSINQRRKETGAAITANSLSQHLIESGLITNWHAEYLLSGKYKGFFLGKYKLQGHLGTGGMSKVYLAEHKISGHLRAIKVLPSKKVADKSYLDRFYLEARAAASLNHPNVVRIYDICQEGNTHYMVMEYVKGKDLAEVIDEQGPLQFENAARYIMEAAEGLRHAHERELVHRDIKPANLLLTEKSSVKILDLGLALVNQDDSQSLTVLYNEKVMGTADYLSPEQAVNSHNVDHRADIYSLGCTLYYLLAAHPPFPDGTLAQRIAKHQTEEPQNLAEIRAECPASLIRICNKMMRKQADDRYQSAIEVKAALRKFIASGEYSGSIIIKESARYNPAAIVDAGDAKPVADPGGLQIDVGGSGKRNVDGKSGKLNVRRRKKPVPKWILPFVIVLMFILMIVVLVVALQNLQ
ncbi:MAG: serine/threonine-protein kinase [Planctomycetota bacterium]